MKALVYMGPESLELQEAPDPSPAADEVVIQVEAVGVCGSDMHAFLGHDDRRPAPLILGHEAAGTIIQGKDEGRRVTVNPLVGCGHCEDCIGGRANLCTQRQIISMPPRQGAFAERVAVPHQNLVFIPEAVSTEVAALTEPVACGWHGVRLAAESGQRPVEGGKVLVLGGGAIGLSAALCAAHWGAAEVWVAETSEARRKTVAQSGEFKVYDPSHPNAAKDSYFDVVIDGVGIVPTREHGIASVRPGGTVVHIGLGSGQDGVDVRRLTLQEIRFLGAYTYTPKDFKDAASAIFSGGLGDMGWSDSLPLSQGAEAFAAMRSGNASVPKFLLRP